VRENAGAGLECAAGMALGTATHGKYVGGKLWGYSKSAICQVFPRARRPFKPRGLVLKLLNIACRGPAGVRSPADGQGALVCIFLIQQ
jgi:hypothetical protein